jgi:hypothetical protein
MIDHPRYKHRSSQRGSALIEFALVLPLLLLITMAALDLGRAFLVNNVLHQAAREGVRMRAVLTASSSDIDSVIARTHRVLRGASIDPAKPENGVAVDIVGPDASHCDAVTVTVNFKWMFPGLFRMVGMELVNPMPLTATCYMRQE